MAALGPEIVIAEFMHEEAVADLKRDYDVLYDPALVDQPDALIEAVAGARALIVRSRIQVRGDVLDAATALEALGRLGVGLDNIDLDACADRSITVWPATGANAASVAEYVIAGILMLRRGAYQSTAEVLAGHWPRTALVGHEVSGGRLGLIGFGAIAREVARRAQALGMTVAAHDPYIDAGDQIWAGLDVAPKDLQLLLAESDAVSLHVPLSPETRHLIDAERLAAMPQGAVLINSSRGGIVDEAALAAALRGGRLRGAMLDVFEQEPLPADSLLAGAPNLILTPHIAGLTLESERRVGALVAAAVRRALEAGEYDGSR